MNFHEPLQSVLTREAILRALGALSDELGQQEVVGELCLFGGTVMVLGSRRAFRLRTWMLFFNPRC